MHQLSETQTPKLREEFQQEVLNFLEYAPPRRLSRSLRNIFLIYLMEDGGQPLGYQEMLNDLYLLFEFLDAADREVESGMLG